MGVDTAAGPGVGTPVGVVDGAGVGTGGGGDAVGAAQVVSMGEQTIMETHLQPDGGAAGADAAAEAAASVAPCATRFVPALSFCV